MNLRNRKPLTDPRKRVLREAEERITKPEIEQSDEITRIGIVWAGLLDLDDVIPATTVAAMLSASELVHATSTYDSESHWIDAAAYAALGAYNEVDDNANSEEKSSSVTSTSHLPKIGFTAPDHSQ